MSADETQPAAECEWQDLRCEGNDGGSGEASSSEEIHDDVVVGEITAASFGSDGDQVVLAEPAPTDACALPDQVAPPETKAAAAAGPPQKDGDLRKLFAMGAAARAAPPAMPPSPLAAEADEQRPPPPPICSDGMLAAFGLSLSEWQELSAATEVSLVDFLGGDEDAAAGAAAERLERRVLGSAVELSNPREVVALLVAAAPLATSGRAICSQLPGRWLDLTGRTDALGSRCLFASRRHENSIFEPLPPERLLRVPAAPLAWQPTLQVPADAPNYAELADASPWIVQCHPERAEVRLLVRPGVLMMRMLRRGTALPSARFSWRISDASEPDAAGALSVAHVRSMASVPLGEFSILSNLEDAAHTQPPHFVDLPLRREQLRSLGWMVAQERRRQEPFVTELREMAPCIDAPHWRLEGRLRCEYTGVRGGVLADAIGYGKTACTIGLVSCFFSSPSPRVPQAYAGLLPSRATLVLAPTNLHAQWLGEIEKFTGKALKVLSIPTYAQLKRLSPREVMDADIVVATYRIFYSTPYLRRLEELVREQLPDFVFPKLPHTAAVAGGRRNCAPPASVTAEWVKAYRKAFDLMPSWAGSRWRSDPTTPERSGAHRNPAECMTPTDVKRPSQVVLDETARSQEVVSKRRRGKTRDSAASASASTAAAAEVPPSAAAAASQAKRCRLTRKQPDMSQSTQAETGPETLDAARDDEIKAGSASLAAPAQFVPLEAFWWRRVVCDEFHELLGRYPPAQAAVELFHADYKWGLSGTPPCQTLAQIRKAASFFGVQIPNDAGAADDGAEVPRQVAQEWLDAFARRNTAEVPPIEEEERIVPVQLTVKERALYDASKQQYDRDEKSGSTGIVDVEDSLGARPLPSFAGYLLKLCSHFCASGAGNVVTADDEVDRQVALRRDQVQMAEKEVASLAERAATMAELVRHFEPHFCREVLEANYAGVAKEKKPRIAARLKFLRVDATGAKPELLVRLFAALAGSSAEGSAEGALPITEAVKQMALRADFKPKDACSCADELAARPPPVWVDLEARAAEVSSTEGNLVLRAIRDAAGRAKADATSSASGPTRCTRLRTSLGMPKWSGRAARTAVDEEGEAEARRAFEEEDWAWRADHRNGQRLRDVVDGWKVELDRLAKRLAVLESEAEAKRGAYQSFVETIEASQAVAPMDAEIEGPSAPANPFAKYGSKIEKIVGHVQRLCANDPTCKIICFVQWEDLKRKISSALREFDVDHLTLQGSVWARRAALMKFQYEEECPRMLLLSLEESASGTNLTAANHVIIVHPMEAATREEAVAFEMQAVGRVRRPGQERKIHVWRFVTVGTIEQQITEEHQKELWERQRTKILVSELDDATQSLMQAESDDEEPAGAREDEGLEDEMSTQAYMPPSLVLAGGTTAVVMSNAAEDAALMPPPRAVKRRKAEAEPSRTSEIDEEQMSTQAYMSPSTMCSAMEGDIAAAPPASAAEGAQLLPRAEEVKRRRVEEEPLTQPQSGSLTSPEWVAQTSAGELCEDKVQDCSEGENDGAETISAPLPSEGETLLYGAGAGLLCAAGDGESDATQRY